MEFVLCYVESPWAWFTSAPLEEQWGDDWDDAPYEHNAGDPYDFRPYMAEHGREPYELKRLAWWGTELVTPDYFAASSPWSVQQINRREVAWLIDQKWGVSGAEVEGVVFAGATMDEFVRAVEDRGGVVYVERESV